MFGNKHSFWQALLMALLIFWTGIILGIFFEDSRADRLKSYYLDSETDIFDLNIQAQMFSGNGNSCDKIMEQNVFFADKIYEEAKKLEKYDASTKITSEVFKLHRRYDLLRAMLWKNIISSNCSERFNVIVYLYQYDEPSMDLEARQITFSKVLLDFKKKYKDKVILIPIAHDTGIKSLDLLRDNYGLDELPVVFINQKHKITDLVTVTELEELIFGN